MPRFSGSRRYLNNRRRSSAVQEVLPRIGPFEANAAVPLSSLSDVVYETASAQTTRTSPLLARNLQIINLTGEPASGYPSVYIHADTIYMSEASVLDAYGLAGEDSNGVSAGAGGRGFNGGGGGGSCSGFGFASGGGGGNLGSDGDPGGVDDQNGLGLFPASGGVGDGDSDGFGYAVDPLPGGAGGAAFGAGGEFDAALSGGGGSSAGRIVIVCNEWITPHATAAIYASGGPGGTDNGLGGTWGDVGGEGTFHLWTKKYPGVIALSMSNWELWEIKTDGSVERHFELTDTWDNT